MQRTRSDRGDWLAIPADQIDGPITPITGDWLAIPADQLVGPVRGDWLAIPAHELITRSPTPQAGPESDPQPRKTVSADAAPASGGLPGFPKEGPVRPKRVQNRRRARNPVVQQGKESPKAGKLGQAKSEGDLLSDRPCQVSLTADGTLISHMPAL
jgi:hypothetical protein